MAWLDATRKFARVNGHRQHRTRDPT